MKRQLFTLSVNKTKQKEEEIIILFQQKTEETGANLSSFFS